MLRDEFHFKTLADLITYRMDNRFVRVQRNLRDALKSVCIDRLPRINYNVTCTLNPTIVIRGWRHHDTLPLPSLGGDANFSIIAIIRHDLVFGVISSFFSRKAKPRLETISSLSAGFIATRKKFQDFGAEKRNTNEFYLSVQQ